MAEKEQIKCPKCGGSSGFYHKYIQSHTQFIGFDGKPLDNSAEVVRGGTKKYCTDCERDITQFVATLELT